MIWVLNEGCNSDERQIQSELEKFLATHHFDGRAHVLFVDLDRCPSCHYDELLDLCQSRECESIGIVIFTTFRAKKKIIESACRVPERVNVTDSPFVKALIEADNNMNILLYENSGNGKAILTHLKEISDILEKCK